MSPPTSSRVGVSEAGALSPTEMTEVLGWTSIVVRIVSALPPAGVVVNSTP